jgi:hypothetical protein
MKTQALLLLSVLWITQNSYSQTYNPNLQDKASLSTDARKFKYIEVNGKKGIRIEEGEGNSVMILNDIIFTSGTVEFDCKGRNVIGKSFLGIAFHIQNDSTYDAIYFRPFNFSNPDTIRRWRAVQYISVPTYEWDKLREQSPGKYENKVNPVPNADEWFHCKIIVKDRLISVFVNNSPKPSLVVTKLTNTSKGKIGLWVENGSDGSFANLEIRADKDSK